MRSIAVFLALAAGAVAQPPGTIAGPSLGMIFDSTAGAVRPLLGVTGAAVMGGPVDSGPALQTAAVAETFALGVQTSDGAAVLVIPGSRSAIPGVPANAGLAALSPRATAGVFYFLQTRTAYLITGLPNAPQVARQIVTANPASQLAVSDDGGTLMTVEQTGRDRLSVMAYTAEQPGVSLWFSPHIRDLEFEPGSQTALVTTPESVLTVSAASGFQTVLDHLAGAVAAAVSGDGQKLAVALQSGEVIVRNLAAQTSATVNCSCQPGTLVRLRGNAVFRLNDINSAPVWVLDADSAAARVVFVGSGQ